MAFSFNICYYLFIFFYLSNYVNSDGKVLFPIKDGQDFGLVFIAGLNTTFQQYEVLAEQVQTRFPHKLWVYITDNDVTPPNSPFSSLTETYFENTNIEVLNINETLTWQAKEALVQAGLPAESPLFTGGHNIGASIIAMSEIEQYPELSKGVVIFGGSRETNEYILEFYPRPFITINGDLDGINRITKVAKCFRYQHFRIVENNDTELKLTFPNVVLSGVNQAQYLTGELPNYVKDMWIEPEVTDETSRELIADAVTSFILYHSSEIEEDREIAKGELESYFDQANQKVIPIYKSFELESSSYQDESPWSICAQEIIADLDEEYEILVNPFNTEFENSTYLFGSQPTIEFLDEQNITVYSYTHNEFSETPLVIAADMMQVKLKSKQALMTVLTGQRFQFVANKTCRDVNEEAWNLVKETIVGEKEKERYMQLNITVIFEEDVEMASGPDWIPSILLFEFNGQELLVQSTSLHTRVSLSLVSDYGGMHYCKLLSPAKVLEFIYVDALYTEYNI